VSVTLGDIRYITANFTPIKTLRAIVTTRTSFGMATTHIDQPTYVSVRFITLDNYIQTYSQARMTGINDKWLNADVDSGFAKLKSTDSVKVTKLVKTGTLIELTMHGH